MPAGRRLPGALPDPVLGRIMIGVAALGVAAGVVGTIVGLSLLSTTGTALGRSLALTTETLDALDTSIELATTTVGVVADSLEDVQATAAALEVTLGDTRTLLGETADLTRRDLAGSIESIQGALPTIIQVAGTIDTTLSALARLPIGPEYDPEEPFGQSLIRVQTSIEDLPDELRRQADLIDAAAVNLEDVGLGVANLVEGVAELDRGLHDALALLDDYQLTAAEGRDVVAESADAVNRQVAWARVAIVLTGLAFVGMQIVPYHLGRRAIDAATLARTPPG